MRLLASLVMLLVSVAAHAETLLIGDSIFARWPQPPFNAFNAAVSGAKIADALTRVGQMAPAPWERVFILIGTNDLSRSGPDAVYQGILSVVHEARTKAPKAAIYVVSILPRGPELKTKREVIVAINRKLSAGPYKFVDAFTRFDRPDLFRDGLHPNEAGYEVLGRVLTEAAK